MRKLETFVNEKLKVTKSSGIPDLTTIIECTNVEEYKLQCKNLIEYLKNDSDLPVAELIDWQNGLKKLARKYQRGYDTFLWVLRDFICYGTWDEMYSMYWSRIKKGTKNYIIGGEGFNDFACNDQELMQSKGVFILTENKEFMEQIEILKQKSVPE